MNKFDKLKGLSPEEFKRITGVTKEVFEEIRRVLQRDYDRTHEKGGRKGLCVELRLTIALEYWREYRTMAHMAIDYDIPISTLCGYITWCEDVLSRSEEFKIRDIKKRVKDKNDDHLKVIIIDVEEQPIERPKHNQKKSYSGKKNGTRLNIR